MTSLVAGADLSGAMNIVAHFRGTPVRDGATSACCYAFRELASGLDRAAEGNAGCAESGMGDALDTKKIRNESAGPTER